VLFERYLVAHADR